MNDYLKFGHTALSYLEFTVEDKTTPILTQCDRATGAFCVKIRKKMKDSDYYHVCAGHAHFGAHAHTPT